MGPTPVTPVATAPDASVDLDVRAVWETTVRPSLKGMVRALYTTVQVVDSADGVVRMSAPTPPHRERCERHRTEVEAALAAAGAAHRIELVVEGAPTEPVESLAHDEEADIDPAELVDAPPAAVPTPLERITQAFPGAQLVGDD